MSRKSDKHKPSGKTFIKNEFPLDRRQVSHRSLNPGPEQPDMGKYIAIGIIALAVFYLLAITIF